MVEPSPRLQSVVFESHPGQLFFFPKERAVLGVVDLFAFLTTKLLRHALRQYRACVKENVHERTHPLYYCITYTTSFPVLILFFPSQYFLCTCMMCNIIWGIMPLSKVALRAYVASHCLSFFTSLSSAK